MLILDKRKAVERMVALTSAGAEADPEQQAAVATATGQRLASFEPAPVAPAAAATTTRRRERRRRRRVAASGPAPA